MGYFPVGGQAEQQLERRKGLEADGTMRSDACAAGTFIRPRSKDLPGFSSVEDAKTRFRLEYNLVKSYFQSMGR